MCAAQRWLSGGKTSLLIPSMMLESRRRERSVCRECEFQFCFLWNHVHVPLVNSTCFKQFFIIPHICHRYQCKSRSITLIRPVKRPCWLFTLCIDNGTAHLSRSRSQLSMLRSSNHPTDAQCERCDDENLQRQGLRGPHHSVNDLTKNIQELQTQLLATNITHMKNDLRRRLEQWCVSSHQKIEGVFERRSRELDRTVDETFDQHRTALNRLRINLRAVTDREEINDQEVESLRSALDDLRQKTTSFEKMHQQLKIVPIPIDDDLIQLTNTRDHQLDLSLLPPVSQTINHPYAGHSPLANNERFFLVYLRPFLTFIDRQLDIVRQLRWPYENIRDMCWSSASDRFVLVERNHLYLVDERSMFIEKIPIESKKNWSSCTSSDESLFLSTDERASSIVNYRIWPSIELRKQWKSPLTCGKEESIDQVVYQNSTLALVITGKSARIELRSSETLHRLWTYLCDSTGEGVPSVHLCSLSFDEWLITDRGNKRLLHLTNEGHLQSKIAYGSTPCRAVLFQPTLLAISRKNGINLHQF